MECIKCRHKEKEELEVLVEAGGQAMWTIGESHLGKVGINNETGTSIYSVHLIMHARYTAIIYNIDICILQWIY